MASPFPKPNPVLFLTHGMKVDRLPMNALLLRFCSFFLLQCLHQCGKPLFSCKGSYLANKNKSITYQVYHLCVLHGNLQDEGQAAEVECLIQGNEGTVYATLQKVIAVLL